MLLADVSFFLLPGTHYAKQLLDGRRVFDSGEEARTMMIDGNSIDVIFGRYFSSLILIFIL
jgi:hypothetical protein